MPWVPADVADAVVSLLLKLDVLEESDNGHIDIRGKKEKTLDLPDRAGRELYRSLVSMLSEHPELDVVAHMTRGTGASGSGAGLPRMSPESQRQRVSQSTRQALSELEWNADTVINGFGPRLYEEASLIVGCILNYLHDTVGSTARNKIQVVRARVRGHHDGESSIIAEVRKLSRGWRFMFGEECDEFGELKGLGYVEQLLRAQGCSLRVELLEGQSPGQTGRPPKGDLRFDPAAWRKANQEYRELMSRLERAQRTEDPIEIGEARGALQQLGEHIQRDRGFAGHGREIDSAADRPRQRVIKAIDYACSKVTKTMPKLGRHLRASIKDRSGWAPRYEPDEGVIWVFTQE